MVVVAKGAKRPYSQLRPVLIPFQQLVVQLGRTPPEASAEVHLLRSAERLGARQKCLGVRRPDSLALCSALPITRCS